LEKIETPEVEDVESLEDTERGTNGYGSTDKITDTSVEQTQEQ
jgi:dUTPase